MPSPQSAVLWPEHTMVCLKIFARRRSAFLIPVFLKRFMRLRERPGCRGDVVLNEMQTRRNFGGYEEGKRICKVVDGKVYPGMILKIPQEKRIVR